MIIISYISTVLSTLRQAAHLSPHPHPTTHKKKRKKKSQWQPPLTPYPICWFLMFICCAISYLQPCVNLECTSDQMLQEQITWSKIPTSESNRYIFYKILIIDCTVPRFFQMSPTFWRVGAPGPQNWNSWLEHCYCIIIIAAVTAMWLRVMSPYLWGQGHIVFGADPVGIGLTLSCLHNVLWTCGWILTKFSYICNWDITWNYSWLLLSRPLLSRSYHLCRTDF